MSSPKGLTLIVLSITGLLLPVISYATDYSSTNFIVKDPVQSGGGGYGSSASFQLWSSFAQPAIGQSSGSNNTDKSGFLYFPGPSATPPPPPPPASPPPAGGGGGGGSGSVTTPIVSPPPTIPPIISIITGEILPPECETPSPKRSDLNCDGAVDLQDLSILLTSPKIVTAKTLSFLFSDWTKKLPFFAPDVSSIAITPGGETFAPPPSGLAEVQSTLPPPSTKISFFGKIGRFVKHIGTGIKALVSLVILRLKF